MAQNPPNGRTHRRRTAALIGCAATLAVAAVYAQRHRDELEELGHHHAVPADPQT